MLQLTTEPPPQANFKPGAATWNTDDPDQQPWLKHRKPRQGGKKAEEPAEAAPKPKAMPTAYMTTAKMTESVQTTGDHPAASQPSIMHTHANCLSSLMDPKRNGALLQVDGAKITFARHIACVD